jgi:pyruvate dehydrogenase E1 component beta subunit
MTKMTFAQAIESALTQAMEEDESVIIMGEDVHTLRLNLFARFGKERVKYTPISESGFVGAAVAAAMGGLRPIAEVMLVDFIAVTMDAILNHAAKISFFSGNKWNVPLVIRTACGGLAHIPGLKIVVPSNPADAGGLMLSSIYEDNPVIYFEHKMLADYWMENMATGGRTTVSFDIPEKGAEGDVPDNWEPIPFGKLNRMKEGNDITFVSLGVSVHRCMEAAKILEGKGVSAEVLDLRTLVPLDVESIKNSVEKTGAVIVVDEDYMQYGLSGEISALLLEEGLSFKYGRVCTEDTIPYAIKLENQVLPNTERIVNKTLEVLNK